MRGEKKKKREKGGKAQVYLGYEPKGGGTEAQLLPEKQKTMRRPYLTLSKMAKKPLFLMNK